MIEFSADASEQILKNGEPMNTQNVLDALEALKFLVELKAIKYDLDSVSEGAQRVMKDYYEKNKPVAWHNARQALGL